MKLEPTLRIGAKPKKVAPKKDKPKPTLLADIKVLDDAALGRAALKELRGAYRELRELIHTHRCEDIIAARTEEALRKTKEAGRKTGGHVDLGYTADEDHVLHPNEHEREIARAAKQLRESGLSLRKVAEELEKEGFAARNKNRFLAAQVKRLVERADTFTKMK